MSAAEERTLSAEQMAEFLQLDIRTVRELLRAGQLPGRKIGREWRCLLSDLRVYLRGEKHANE